MGAASLTQVRSTQVITLRTRPLNWVNVGWQATCAVVRSVVVLAIVGSGHKNAYSLAWSAPYRGVLPPPPTSLLDGRCIIKI